MDDGTAIKVENVSKKYCKSLKRSMLYGVNDIGRNTFGLSSHSDRLRNGEFWAVDDISFEVKKGETLGIIGPNGSGKTTLLKMLNGIFWPDKGKITMKGEVGALIEIGAGFHPLLTGRENIYINAAILGMNKKYVDEKIEDIIKFADIGDFIDTPVKFYSSGMFVRLGFAVAVHCEPDILLVDEVLAVGDTSFINKCYKRLHEIKSDKNAAILIVSHNLYILERFCDKGIFISHGKNTSYGEIHKVIGDYQVVIYQLIKNQQSVAAPLLEESCIKSVKITNVKLLTQDGKEQKIFNFKDTLRIRLEYESKDIIHNPQFQIILWSYDGKLISAFGPHLDNLKISNIDKGKGVAECWIEKLPLLANRYYITVGMYDKTRTITLDYWAADMHTGLSFGILPNLVSTTMGEMAPICHFNSKWLINGKQLNRT
jgi:lipopolysaccharide transport system ATP-binding protein